MLIFALRWWSLGMIHSLIFLLPVFYIIIKYKILNYLNKVKYLVLHNFFLSESTHELSESYKTFLTEVQLTLVPNLKLLWNTTCLSSQLKVLSASDLLLQIWYEPLTAAEHPQDFVYNSNYQPTHWIPIIERKSAFILSF